MVSGPTELKSSSPFNLEMFAPYMTTHFLTDLFRKPFAKIQITYFSLLFIDFEIGEQKKIGAMVLNLL